MSQAKMITSLQAEVARLTREREEIEGVLRVSQQVVATLRDEKQATLAQYQEKVAALLAAQGEIRALKVRLETALPDEVCGDTLDRALQAEKERDEAREERARAGARADKSLCDLQDANSRILRLEAALRDFVGSAPHWRTFLTTRERIHVDGLRLFDEVVTDARNLLETMGMKETK